MRNLQGDRNGIIKLEDKGFAAVIWDRNDCLKEAEKTVEW